MMKKIFIIFSILYILNFNIVYADTIESDALIDNPYVQLVKSEKRYMWYKENLEDIGYSDDTNIDLNSTYIDIEDYILEYSDWREYNDEERNNLEFRKIYNYQTITPFKYIEINSNISSHNISEIEIFVEGEKINYSAWCSNCSASPLSYLNDGIIDDDNIYVLSSLGKILLVLDKNYPVDKIEVKFYIKNSNDNTFNIYFTSGQYKYDHTIIKKNIVLENDYTNNIKWGTFRVDDTWEFNVEYSDIIKSEEYIEDNWYTKVNVNIECRDVIKKYHYYNIKREYIDGYYKDPPDTSDNYILKKDEDKYKIFYIYETIENNLDFSDTWNNDFKLDDLFNNYVPNQNIDYSSLNFELPQFDIDKFLGSQNNNINIEDFYNNQKFNNFDTLEDNQKIEKIDVSKYKTRKIEDNNISKYFNFKNLKRLGLSILFVILLILFINSRYRKS